MIFSGYTFSVYILLDFEPCSHKWFVFKLQGERRGCGEAVQAHSGCQSPNLTLTTPFTRQTKALFSPPRWRMSYTTLWRTQSGYWELTSPALADREAESLNHTLWNRSVGSCFNYSVRTSVDFEILWMLPQSSFRQYQRIVVLCSVYSSNVYKPDLYM